VFFGNCVAIAAWRNDRIRIRSACKNKLVQNASAVSNTPHEIYRAPAFAGTTDIPIKADQVTIICADSPQRGVQTFCITVAKRLKTPEGECPITSSF
jgi:hypothetical protein